MHRVRQDHPAEAFAHHVAGHVDVADGLLLDPGAVLDQGHRCGADVLAGRQRLAGAVASGPGEVEEVGSPVGAAGAEDLDQPPLLEVSSRSSTKEKGSRTAAVSWRPVRTPWT